MLQAVGRPLQFRRLLFPDVSDTSSSPSSTVVALIACDGCPADGFHPDLTPSLYLSSDSGRTWRETQLPDGLWRLDTVGDDASVLLLRGEPAPSDRFNGGALAFGDSPVHVDRVRYPGATVLETLPEWPSPVVAPLQAADGSLWSIPDRRFDDEPLTTLLRDGVAARDFSPYVLLEIASDPTRTRIAVSLGCAINAARPCHPDLAHTAVLVLVPTDGDSDTFLHLAIDRALSPPGSPGPNSPAPWIRDVRWLAAGQIVASLTTAPPLTTRPLLLDLAAGRTMLLAEPDTQFGAVTPITVREGAPPPVTTTINLPPGDCLHIRPLPRIDGFHDPLACLPGATPLTLPGETATDAQGNHWTYVQTATDPDDIQGWAATQFLTAPE